MIFNEVEIFDVSEIMSFFSQGLVSGLFYGSFCFAIGYVLSFVLDLMGDKVK